MSATVPTEAPVFLRGSCNQSKISEFSLFFKVQNGNIIAEQLAFNLIHQEKEQAVKKLNFITKGKLTALIDYKIPEGKQEPLWEQLHSFKLTDIDFKLSDFLLSQKDFQLDMKQSSLIMTELAIIKNKKNVLKNLLIPSLAMKSDQINFYFQKEDQYHLKKIVLKINNLPILTDNKLFDPLSHQFLTKFAHNSQIDALVDKITENDEQGINHFKVKLQGKNKIITLSNLGFKALDSKINITGALSLQKKIPMWSLETQSDKLNLKPISNLLNLLYGLEGYLTINNKLSGSLEKSDIKINDGRIYAKGNNIILNDIDLDKILNDFESSQQVGLLDVSAVTLLGPAGIALSKGNHYTSLIQSLKKGGKSKITQLNSDISWSNDIASMDDVSFTTGKHQLVVNGQLDFLNERFIDFFAATVDKYGCSIYKESVTGSLYSPSTKKASVLVKSLINPIKSVTSRVTSKIQKKCKEPFYSGSLKLEETITDK